MSEPAPARRVNYVRLLAPLVLVLLAVGWYEYSVVYIQGADDQLVSSGNLAVYVTVQQVQSYLVVLLPATIIVVALGIAAFAYNAARLLVKSPK